MIKQIERSIAVILILEILCTCIFGNGFMSNTAQAFSAPTVTYYNGHRYQRFDSLKNWDVAKAYCESLGGHLVTITSAEEQKAACSLLDGDSHCWTGGYKDNGSWKWITGEPFSYSNWWVVEPNGSGPYIEIYSTSHTWDDTYNRDLRFICEWDDYEYTLFTSKLPKLSDESAKMFLGFLYCDKKYEERAHSDSQYYNLLIGNYESFESIDEIKICIWNFSTFARSMMNTQERQSSHAVEYLVDDLVVFWMEQYEGMNEIDAEILNEVSGKLSKGLKDGLDELVRNEMAETTLTKITEKIFKGYDFVTSAYGDLEQLSKDIQDYANKLVAVVETAILPFESEFYGRARYFNDYLSCRKNFDTKDDEIFRIEMEYNLFAITNSNTFNNLLWFYGKDSWTEHVDLIEEWAENLYQLEEMFSEETHQYKTQVANPTCYEVGESYDKCIICNRRANRKLLPKLEHEIKEGICTHCGVCNSIITIGKHNYDGQPFIEDGTGSYFQQCVDCNGESLHIHAVGKEEACEASCIEDGNIAYWYQIHDGVKHYFIDEDCTMQIKKEDTIIPSLGHNYEPSFAWSEDGENCTITLSCRNNMEHVMTDNCVITSEEKVSASCSRMEIKLYTATYGIYKDTTEIQGTLDSTKHEVTEIRNKKNATCKELGYTGDIYCKNCDSVVEQGSEIAKIPEHVWDTGKIIKHATVTEKGEKLYTCTVCNDTKIEELPLVIIWDVPDEWFNTNLPNESDKKEDSQQEEDKSNNIDMTNKPSNSLENESDSDKWMSDDWIMDAEENAFYEIIESGKNKVVSYVSPVDKNCFHVKIPDEVIIDEVTYKVIKIEEGAFKNNNQLQWIKIGDNIKIIGDKAFYGCSKLKSVIIGENVISIGDKAFYKCISLVKITIPLKVKKIGSFAFSGCKKVKVVNIETEKLSLDNIGKNAFKNLGSKNYKKVVVTVPKKKIKKYENLLKQKGLSSKIVVKE